MVRVFSALSTALLVFALGCSSEVSGGGSPSGGDTTGTGTSGSTSGGAVSDITTCAELESELTKERQAIQSCTSAAECGQDLKGTSCGCTRNLVARLDADAARFYELIERNQELECSEITAGTCDCPAADGFDCENGFCGWNYTQ